MSDGCIGVFCYNVSGHAASLTVAVFQPGAAFTDPALKATK